MEAGREDDDPGRLGSGRALGFRGEGVLIKFEERDRGIALPVGRSIESADGLCERDEEPACWCCPGPPSGGVTPH